MIKSPSDSESVASDLSCDEVLFTLRAWSFRLPFNTGLLSSALSSTSLSVSAISLSSSLLIWISGSNIKQLKLALTVDIYCRILVLNKYSDNCINQYLLCFFELFWGFTVATDVALLLFAVLDTGVGLEIGWGSFFFGGGSGLGSLSDESESELLSVDAEDPEPDPAELFELAELSDLANCLVIKPKNDMN